MKNMDYINKLCIQVLRIIKSIMWIIIVSLICKVTIYAIMVLKGIDWTIIIESWGICTCL